MNANAMTAHEAFQLCAAIEKATSELNELLNKARDLHGSGIKVHASLKLDEHWPLTITPMIVPRELK